jgi:hypothetical protein
MAPGVVVVEEGNQQQEDAPPPPRPPLAVEALRDKIVEKVKANRVTLIVGDTGCGNYRGFPSPITFSIGSTVCGSAVLKPFYASGVLLRPGDGFFFLRFYLGKFHGICVALVLFDFLLLAVIRSD